MLKFIFGRAASGKTTTVLNMIENDVKDGNEAVLIIPEQFSFESERAILKRLGDSYSKKVTVLSFTRLCDEVERITGGICGTTLTDSDKMILMCKAVSLSSGDLKLWSRYKNSIGFSKAILETIEEFKVNAVSPEELLETSNKNLNKSLSAKLHDISVIYKNYNILIGEKFIDPSERLTKLYNRLQNVRYFENKNVYIDSFKYFTGQQFKIINRIISQSLNTFVTLTNSDGAFNEFDIFSNIRKTVHKIKKYAELHNVKISDDINLSNNFYKFQNLTNVEKLLSCGQTDDKTSDESVTICKALTVYDEAEFTARNIRKLVRENPKLRYRDIVIIARDTALYEEAVFSACKKNNVSCFIDKRIPLSSFPPVSAALAAINAVNGFSTEAILRFYKTGLSDINYKDISTIENYAFLWNIDGKMWEKEWDMNPMGFVCEDMNESATQLLNKINEIRKKIISPFIKFKSNFKGNAADRTKALIDLFEGCNSKKALNGLLKIFKEENDLNYADALSQSWDVFMSLLNSIVVCLGEGSITTKEFTNMLNISVSLSSIGVIPQMLDEVTFGAADRIRPSRPKVAFILGANQNIFPKALSNSGLLGTADRNLLVSEGIEISDKSISEALDEELLVYTNVCCPSEKLFISYRTTDGENNEIAPSSFVELIKENIDCNEVNFTSSTYKNYLPETAETAFSLYCKLFSQNNPESENIAIALMNHKKYKEKINAVKKGFNSTDKSINKDTADKLFGNAIKISPSKLDVFMRCNFSFFCKYGIKARKIQPAEFDVLQRGTIVHYVLQKTVEKYGKNLANLDELEISAVVDCYINEYLEGIIGFKTIESVRMKYLIHTIARSVKEVVIHLSNEFAQSGFEPVKCEFEFGSNNNDFPEIIISDNKKILLEGTIDRIDIWDEYIRIVDYKTGMRKFKLPDILVGQNMQMLIYLYALKKQSTYSKNKPAGIFYMPALRNINDSKLKMDGLSILNENVVKAMDQNNSGEFVTALKYKKTGEIYENCKNAFVEENDFDLIFNHIERLIKKMGNEISNGKFDINPIDGLDSPACKYCDFSSICGIEKTECKKASDMNNSEVIEILKEMQSNGI